MLKLTNYQKCKWKLHWNIILLKSEYLSLRKQIISGGRCEQQETLGAVPGNACFYKLQLL